MDEEYFYNYDSDSSDLERQYMNDKLKHLMMGRLNQGGCGNCPMCGGYIGGATGGAKSWYSDCLADQKGKHPNAQALYDYCRANAATYKAANPPKTKKATTKKATTKRKRKRRTRKKAVNPYTYPKDPYVRKGKMPTRKELLDMIKIYNSFNNNCLSKYSKLKKKGLARFIKNKTGFDPEGRTRKEMVDYIHTYNKNLCNKGLNKKNRKALVNIGNKAGLYKGKGGRGYDQGYYLY